MSLRRPDIRFSLVLFATWVALMGCAGGSGSSHGDTDTSSDTGPYIDTDSEPDDPLSSEAAALACGQDHTCALTAAGGVKCWGSNQEGSLGCGSYSCGGPTPMYAQGMVDDFVAISARSFNSCAVKQDATAWCWGDNQSMQLGADILEAESNTPLPVVGLGEGVIQIENGTFHTCALLDDESVKCWGNNGDGQLGNGIDLAECVDFNDCIESSPVDVLGLSEPNSKLSLGGTSYAITAYGSVLFWGYLGNWGGSSGETSSIPALFEELSSEVTEISNGLVNCAVVEDGTVLCWGGINSLGQLGNGNTDETFEIVETVGLTEAIVDIGASSQGHTCAMTETGGVECWGDNRKGGLGIGSSDSEPHSTPTTVVGLDKNVTSICAGGAHTCVIIEGGGVKCWGEGGSGQLGNGLDTSVCDQWDDCLFPSPVDVLGFGDTAIIGTMDDYDDVTELVGTWTAEKVGFVPDELVVTSTQIVASGDYQLTDEVWSVTYGILRASNNLDRLKVFVVSQQNSNSQLGDIKYYSYVQNDETVDLYGPFEYDYPYPVGGMEGLQFHRYAMQ